MIKFFLTLVGNVNTFNLKNHQVLVLKRPSRNDWQTIYSRVGQKGPPPGSDRIKTHFSNLSMIENSQYISITKPPLPSHSQTARCTPKRLPYGNDAKPFLEPNLLYLKIGSKSLWFSVKIGG